MVLLQQSNFKNNLNVNKILCFEPNKPYVNFLKFISIKKSLLIKVGKVIAN